jgi:hypothetical protein
VQASEFRFGDSPWFWLSLFGTVALVALSLISQKYAQRQMRLEQRYQNRLEAQAAQRAGRQDKPSALDRAPSTPGARPGRPRASLAPLVILFASLAMGGYIGLYIAYRRHRSGAARARLKDATTACFNTQPENDRRHALDQ